ncbi:hypothetical protein TCELL_1014 [Thermogladius calderae 1633]|uniref:Uncharacterized protein n=2 Tax=Thermogladius calderae TaxID=1200300 RepID=I3TF99_THEC1|nr:hypothetical protein TCELL_1014 [Thermogladius calderae 1633]
MVCLFRDRLEVLKSALGNKLPEALDPLKLAYCAGVLHDLGKASGYYLEEFKKNYRRQSKKELTFPLHEHVVGVVLEWLALRESNEHLKAYYDLLAKVVSRHHAAQPGRHPAKVLLSEDAEKNAEVMARAIKGFTNPRVKTFLNKLEGVCRNSNYCGQCSKVLEVMKAVKGTEFENVAAYVGTYAKSYTSLDSLSGYPNVDKAVLHRLVTSITGALIVADNLVADYERRTSSDEVGRLYVEYWKVELADELKQCTGTKP